MVAGDHQSAAVQGNDRSANRSRAHHHYRGRLLPVPPHLSAAQGGQIMRKGQGTGAEVLNPGESGIGGSNPGERAMGAAYLTKLVVYLDRGVHRRREGAGAVTRISG